MIKERYCSYEVSKLLKKKGFDKPCYRWYDSNGDICAKFINPDIPLNYLSIERYLCPTHQMAIDWLGEKGIYITIVYGDYPAFNKVFWTPQIDSLKGFNLPDDFYKDYDKYGEACEAALKYALKNLV